MAAISLPAGPGAVGKGRRVDDWGRCFYRSEAHHWELEASTKPSGMAEHRGTCPAAAVVAAALAEVTVVVGAQSRPPHSARCLAVMVVVMAVAGLRAAQLSATARGAADCRLPGFAVGFGGRRRPTLEALLGGAGKGPVRRGDARPISLRRDLRIRKAVSSVR